MCWCGKDNREIAKIDIPVFKIVQKDPELGFISYYRYFQYKVGDVYSSRIKKIIGPEMSYLSINNGLHSYSNDCKIAKIGCSFFISSCKGYEVDFCVEENERKLYKLECVIPRGSAYYKNKFGEIVSSRLKILKAIQL